MMFFANVSFASLPVFLPQIIKEYAPRQYWIRIGTDCYRMGYTSTAAQALTIPPNILAFFVILLTTWLSDRYRSRSVPIIFLCLTSAFGYTLLASAGTLQRSLNNLPDEINAVGSGSQRWWEVQLQAGAQMVSTSSLTAARYAGITLAASTIFSIVAIVIVWNGNNSETETSRGAGQALLQMLGQCGPLLGTRLYPDSHGPEYITGSTVCAMSMLVVCILVGVQRWRLKRINRERDKEELMARAESVDGEGVQKRFRFML